MRPGGDKAPPPTSRTPHEYSQEKKSTEVFRYVFFFLSFFDDGRVRAFGMVAKMAALKEEQCYGLSCGRVSNGSNVSVFHVKLTDSALRAFEDYRGSKVRERTGLWDRREALNPALRSKHCCCGLSSTASDSQANHD